MPKQELTAMDHVIDRRTGERLRFSRWRNHPYHGVVACCIKPGERGLTRVRQVPLDKIRKVKTWMKNPSPRKSFGIVADTQTPPS